MTLTLFGRGTQQTDIWMFAAAWVCARVCRSSATERGYAGHCRSCAAMACTGACQPGYATHLCQSMFFNVPIHVVLCCAPSQSRVDSSLHYPPPPPPHTHTTPHPRPQLDAWVESHEAAEAARRAAAQAAMAEDGWTVVTRTKVTHLGHTGLYLLWLTQ
jgi:hypothetical protein